MDTEKVYYSFTPHPDPVYVQTGLESGDRACVALTKRGDTYIYGISICSYGDQFSRSKGRELALERMNKGFASTKYSRKLDGESEQDQVLSLLNCLTESIWMNFGKWKRRIELFNKRGEPRRIGFLQKIKGHL